MSSYKDNLKAQIREKYRNIEALQQGEVTEGQKKAINQYQQEIAGLEANMMTDGEKSSLARSYNRTSYGGGGKKSGGSGNRFGFRH